MRFARVSASFPPLESKIVCEDDSEHMFLDLDGSPEEEADTEAEYDCLFEDYESDQADPIFAMDHTDPFFEMPFTW